MNNNKAESSKEIDTVLVHKDKCMLAAYVCVASSYTKKIDVYAEPQQFLANAIQYPKNTKIMLGRTFDMASQTGLQIAYHLHELGFERLYLITADKLLKHEIPDYLTNISVVDVDEIISVLTD